MLAWIAHMALIGFFTFIVYVFLAAINLKLYKSLALALGILFALNITITDLAPAIKRINDLAGMISGRDAWELPVKGNITQRFNPPEHHGIDIAVPVGTPVYAQGTGKVVLAEYQEIYGNVIIIRYQNGYEGVYAHLSKMHVKYGDRVLGDSTRSMIGKTGNTGRSDGPHLHWEIRIDGKAIDPMSL